MTTVNFADLKPFFEVFQKESDRACGVLAAALLDTLLETLLKKAMLPTAPKELFDGQGPLSTFSAKVDQAFYFGLISKEDHHDLHLIRRIRNDFAHALDQNLSFATHSITQRVSNLKLPKILFEHPTLQVSADNPRLRFEIAIGILAYLLSGQRVDEAKQAQEPQSFSTVIWLFRTCRGSESGSTASGQHK